MKLRSVYKAKDNVNRTKQESTERENISPTSHLTGGLIYKIYKKFKKLDINKSNNPIKKSGMDQN